MQKSFILILALAFLFAGSFAVYYFLIIAPSLDPQKCPQEERPDVCYSRIATAKKDPDYCQLISNEEYRDKCFLWIAEKTKKLSDCFLAKNLSTQEECQYDLAYSTINLSLCSNLPHPKNVTLCQQDIGALVGKKSGSIETCSQGPKGFIDGCFEGVAEATKKASLCANIQETDVKHYCYFQLARLLHSPQLCSNINISEQERTCGILATQPLPES